MNRFESAPIPLAVAFIDRINHGDVAGLGDLMTDDHELRIFDEAPMAGRDNQLGAWEGYAASYPRYLIHPHAIAAQGSVAAVLGHTTGSHLGLPDDEESKLTLIWLLEERAGKAASWTLIEDTPATRAAWGLP